MAPAGIGDSVEGFHAVAAAAAAGRVSVLFVERGRADDPGVIAVVDQVERSGGAVRLVDDVTAQASTSAPQGVVAEARPLPTVDVADLAVPAAAIIVLDHLQDPRNAGAIARSALAAGFTGLVVPSRRAAPLSATAFKSAAGALEHLPVAVVSSVPRALETLKAAGIWIVGLDGTAAESLFDLDLLTEPVAVVVGSEGEGLSRLVADVSDVVVSIPIDTAVESLNAASAATLACFEVARRRADVI